MNRDRLLADLKRDEGTGPIKLGRMLPYADTVGKQTIGWGRNLTDKGISVAEGEMLLSNDLDEAIRACMAYAWFVSMDVVRQAAVANMIFNLGPTAFGKFHRTVGAFAQQDYEAAAVFMLESKWADQVGARAIRLAEQIRSGEWK